MSLTLPLQAAPRLPPTLQLFGILFFALSSVYIILLVTRLLLFWHGQQLRRRNRYRRREVLRDLGVHESDMEGKKIVGLFHPYCNAGGGGERVLWTAVAFHQREHQDVVCAVYTGDIEATKPEIIAKVKERFDITLHPETLALIPLKRRAFVEDSRWPRFTLLGQSLGSVWLGYEALTTLIPDIYIDTMGYAFTFPLFKYLGGVPVGAYVHYPTISTDMLERVATRKAGTTNSGRVAASSVLTGAKLIYYHIFAELYSVCLRQADYVMVNSSWTKNHVDRMLKTFLHRDDDDDDINTNADGQLNGESQAPTAQLNSTTLRKRHASPVPIVPRFSAAPKFRKSTIVYPPCDTRAFRAFPLHPRPSPYTILSISQFRPEKAQHLQILSLAHFLRSHPEFRRGEKMVKLVLAGSVRNEGDEGRVEMLRRLAKDEGVEGNVEFKVNVKWGQLKELLAGCMVGMNTMVDEHFGISVVEFMASGLVPLVHASGGPFNDIVVPYKTFRIGFYATDAEGYSDQLHTIFTLPEPELTTLRENARAWAEERFSEEGFEKGWKEGWTAMVGMEARVGNMRKRWDHGWWP